MESVKIGSVGLGRLGYEHAKNLAASIPGCVLHAICNVDTSRLRAVAEELGVPHTYTDFAAMCADPDLMPEPEALSGADQNCHGARQARFL